MITDNIPKSFWHSLSVSVLILTAGFVYVSVKSGNLVVKYADLEFKTSSAETAIADAQAALEAAKQESDARSEKLRKEKAQLEKALADAKQKIDAFVATQTATGTSTSRDEVTKLKEQLVLPSSIMEREPFPLDIEPTVRPQQSDHVQLKIEQLGKIREQLQER